jgi:regulator of sirC expression with transglutaminase-like and TPR domain
MTPREAMEHWKGLLSRDESSWELAEAALLFAAGEYPDLDVAAYLQKLDDLAEECRSAIETYGLEGPRAAARLCRYLFELAGYLGNREEYADPRNSYLNEVLDRKLGLPITLSVVAISVGRRLGIPLEGVGMPGHFLLRSPEGEVYFDPFAGGHPVTAEECRERLEAIYGDRLPWSDAYLEPVSRRQILIRMLNNLKLSYLQRNDFFRARNILEFYMVLDPGSSSDRVLLAQLREWLNRLN